jgi:hypothetical protein
MAPGDDTVMTPRRSPKALAALVFLAAFRFHSLAPFPKAAS